jgi:hypothetical protein
VCVCVYIYIYICVYVSLTASRCALTSMSSAEARCCLPRSQGRGASCVESGRGGSVRGSVEKHNLVSAVEGRESTQQVCLIPSAPPLGEPVHRIGGRRHPDARLERSGGGSGRTVGGASATGLPEKRRTPAAALPTSGIALLLEAGVFRLHICPRSDVVRVSGLPARRTGGLRLRLFWLFAFLPSRECTIP